MWETTLESQKCNIWLWHNFYGEKSFENLKLCGQPTILKPWQKSNVQYYKNLGFDILEV